MKEILKCRCSLNNVFKSKNKKLKYFGRKLPHSYKSERTPLGFKKPTQT